MKEVNTYEKPPYIYSVPKKVLTLGSKPVGIVT
jgi:hypothetical protein